MILVSRGLASSNQLLFSSFQRFFAAVGAMFVSSMLSSQIQLCRFAVAACV
jgi:hypothetical protein